MRAFYFGYCQGSGHVFQNEDGKTIWNIERDVPDFPPAWMNPTMDTGLLRNSREPDKETGMVKWTCSKSGWFAFVWWDRSGDKRPNSNSGFYVHLDKNLSDNFEEMAKRAFEFACKKFPKVVDRQNCQLVLVLP